MSISSFDLSNEPLDCISGKKFELSFTILQVRQRLLERDGLTIIISLFRVFQYRSLFRVISTKVNLIVCGK